MKNNRTAMRIAQRRSDSDRKEQRALWENRLRLEAAEAAELAGAGALPPAALPADTQPEPQQD